MNSPRPLRWMMLPCAAALLCAVTTHAQTTAVDSGWILSKLAQPAPMRTSFVEVRSSRLLKNPLRLSGEYELLLTQRLILQPRMEVNLYRQRDEARLLQQNGLKASLQRGDAPIGVA